MRGEDDYLSRGKFSVMPFLRGCFRSSFFHFPLTDVKARWHRILIFMEDSVTVISVTYEKVVTGMQIIDK